MNNKVEEYMRDLVGAQKQVKEGERQIERESGIYESKYDSIATRIGNLKEDLHHLEKSTIDVRVKRVVEELAKLWDTNVDNLNVVFHTNVSHSSLDPDASILMHYAEELEKLGKLNMIFIVSEKTKDGGFRSESFSSVLKFDAMQVDGRPLYDHLSPVVHEEINKNKNGDESKTYGIDLKVDNWRKVILTYPISELISQNKMCEKGFSCDDTASMAVLNAYERNLASKFQEDEGM